MTVLLGVSILTRPSGRVQPNGLGVCGGNYWFQSSPGLLAGCNEGGGRRCPIADQKFQSSPGLLAGCNALLVGEVDGDLLVSILTRPSGRVQLANPWLWAVADWCFNPHPAFWPGATADSDTITVTINGFNPHPAFWPGATANCAAFPPSRSTGFNPHPAFWPGATRSAPMRSWPRSSFNPHPAFWPGATTADAIRVSAPEPVSILTRPSGRVQHGNPPVGRVN